MAAHSRILAWRIPWTEEPGGLQSTGLPKVNMTERLSPGPSYSAPPCIWGGPALGTWAPACPGLPSRSKADTV